MGIGEFFGSIWNGFKTGASWLWQNVARPVIGGIGSFMKSPFVKPVTSIATALFPQAGGAIKIASDIGTTIGTLDDTLKQNNL
jgi:hypothetical protein